MVILKYWLQLYNNIIVPFNKLEPLFIIIKKSYCLDVRFFEYSYSVQLKLHSDFGQVLRKNNVCGSF